MGKRSAFRFLEPPGNHPSRPSHHSAAVGFDKLFDDPSDKCRRNRRQSRGQACHPVADKGLGGEGYVIPDGIVKTSPGLAEIL